MLSQGLTGARRLFRRAQRFPESGRYGAMVVSSEVPGTNGTMVKNIIAAAIDPDWFWSYVEKIPFHTCWEWTGVLGQRGYGTYHQRGGRAVASRVAWALTHGDTPADLLVCHKCDNPSCVRPDHLFLGTVADNSKDCSGKGRVRNQLAEQHAAKTQCKQGHPLTGDNLIRRRPNAGGGRACRTCQRAAGARYMQRQRDEAKRAKETNR